MTTPVTHHQTDSETDDYFTPAVLFLSMATTAGAELTSNGEPTRIQVQREAGHRKAIELGAGIVKEFVEIGSGTNWTKRPVLKRMLRYLDEHPEAKYAIFPGPHRFSRNMGDSAILRQRFEELDVEVVFSQGGTDSPHVTVAEILHGIDETAGQLDTPTDKHHQRERTRRGNAYRQTMQDRTPGAQDVTTDRRAV